MPRAFHLYDGDTFLHRSRTFRVTFPFDDTCEAPWERGDGHGPVSEWTRRAKRAGERELASDHGHKRFYDVQEAMKIAKRDGWDAEPYGGSKGEKAARAVEADFEFLRRWCNDQWHYVGCVVALLDGDGEEVESTSLWGIESDSREYLDEVARELADELSESADAAMARDIEQSRPDMQMTEA